MACSTWAGNALLAVCQEIPRAAATRQTDMRSRARARSPHSTAAWVSRALGSARPLVSCLHTRRQPVQAKRRRRTTSCVGLHPTGTWARRRATGPTGYSLGPAGSAEGVLEPDRHTALHNGPCGGEVLAHRGQSQGIQAQEGRQVRAGEGSLRHVEVSQVACVAAPIIGGPRHLPTATTHPPLHLRTSIGSSYHTLKREEPVTFQPTNGFDLSRIKERTSKSYSACGHVRLCDKPTQCLIGLIL